MGGLGVAGAERRGGVLVGKCDLIFGLSVFISGFSCFRLVIFILILFLSIWVV